MNKAVWLLAVLAVLLVGTVGAAMLVPPAAAPWGVTVNGDTNGDGKLSPGEYARVSWVTTGSEPASKDLPAERRHATDYTLTIKTPKVSWKSLEGYLATEPTRHHYDHCLPWCRDGKGSDSVWVKLAPDYPPGTSLDFELCCFDDGKGGQLGPVKRSLPVTAPETKLALHPEASFSEPSGDGILRPGEFGRLDWYLLNPSAVNIAGLVTYKFRITTPGVTWKVPGKELGTTPTEHHYDACAAGGLCSARLTDDEVWVKLAPDFKLETPVTIELFDLVDHLGVKYPALTMNLVVK
jgi:hypothetical protein